LLYFFVGLETRGGVAPADCWNWGKWGLLDYCHRLNMEVDLQSSFGLHVTWCAQLYLLAETPQPPPTPSPRHGTRIRGR
jgi:hypothetical protein